MLYYLKRVKEVLNMDKKIPLWVNDRNFNTEEVENSKYYYVAEHNDLITKARHDLNAQELKIMDFIVSKIKPDDEKLNIVNTSMYEISQVLGMKRSGRTYSQLAFNLNELRKKDVYIYNDDERSVTMTGWFESTKLWEDGKVQIRINKDFTPYLIQLKGNYTQHLLLDTVQLNSRYSILLYKLLREADKSQGKKITILSGTPDEFKEWLGAPKSYAFKDLNKNVLQKAVDEINLKIDDMDLEILKAKRGRKVVQVEIHNNFNPQNHIMDTENSEMEPKIPLFNWLEK